MHGQPKNLAASTSDQITEPGTRTVRPRTGPRRAGPGHADPGLHRRALPDAFNPKSPRDPHWFKTAVFYEVSVRGYADSNNDGYGDLRGLISKLDHLQWLGI
ncbi:MAG TPA: hypothetical protein VIL71_01710, partial [Spirillospora sp.]